PPPPGRARHLRPGLLPLAHPPLRHPSPDPRPPRPATTTPRGPPAPPPAEESRAAWRPWPERRARPLHPGPPTTTGHPGRAARRPRPAAAPAPPGRRPARPPTAATPAR